MAAHRPASVTAAQAEAAEAAGFEGCFSVELHSSPFVPLGVAAATTSRRSLATGIALTFTRSPFETACEALDLDRASEGRFCLGTGASVRDWQDRAHGVAYDPPVAGLAEAIQVTRMVTTGFADGRRTFEGRHYRADFTGLQLRARCGRTCPSGWRPCVRRCASWPAGGPTACSATRRGRSRGHASRSRAPTPGACRPPGGNAGTSPSTCGSPSPHPDRAQAVQDAKRPVAFYASIGQYLPYAEAHGFGAEAAALAEAAAAGRPDPSLVSEDMARAFVVCGSPGQVSATLQGPAPPPHPR